MGVEPKGEGISGQSGYKDWDRTVRRRLQRQSRLRLLRPEVEEQKNKAAEPTKANQHLRISQHANANPDLPVAKAVRVDFNPESVRPW